MNSPYAFEDADALRQHWSNPNLGFMQKVGGMFQSPEQRMRGQLAQALRLASMNSQGRLDDPLAGNEPPIGPPPVDRQAVAASLYGWDLDPEMGTHTVPPVGLGPEEPRPRGMFSRGFDAPAAPRPSARPTSRPSIGGEAPSGRLAGPGGGLNRAAGPYLSRSASASPTSERLRSLASAPSRPSPPTPASSVGRGLQPTPGHPGGVNPGGFRASDLPRSPGLRPTPGYTAQAFNPSGLPSMPSGPLGLRPTPGYTPEATNPGARRLIEALLRMFRSPISAEAETRGYPSSMP